MKMGDFNLAIETAIIDALTVKMGEPIPVVLEYALENVKNEYPFVTLEMVKKTYEDIMYDL
jgi:hypothetical protein